MPYIPQERRQVALDRPVGSGELDFQITKNVLAYLDREGWNFTTMNAIVGVLENVKDEFQRRIMYPYEDCKIIEHGDVYPPHICEQ